MLYYKMSLTLLQSFVSEITANDAEMAKNKKDIDDIKSQLIIMNDYIKALKDFDVKEEKEEEEIRADIKDIQQKIAALKAKIALQVAVDVDAAVVIVDLQAEIMALKAKIELHETINSEDNEIINQEVDNLQEDVKVLQDNDKKEEADKAIALADEIATLEAQLKELTMATNVVKPATHPELFLGESDVPEVANTNHPLLM